MCQYHIIFFMSIEVCGSPREYLRAPWASCCSKLPGKKPQKCCGNTLPLVVPVSCCIVLWLCLSGISNALLFKPCSLPACCLARHNANALPTTPPPKTTNATMAMMMIMAGYYLQHASTWSTWSTQPAYSIRCLCGWYSRALTGILLAPTCLR